jgi:hypothetical protein
MGLMGVVAGASTAGILGAVRLMGDTWLPRLAASSEHKHQMISSLHSQRHDSVQSWRAGLANARDTYRQWAAGPRDHDPPNAVGDEWFEGLRPHLPSTGEAAKYRTALDSTATTRLWHCCRWRLAGSNGNGSTRRGATRAACGTELSSRPAGRPARAADPAGRG